LKKLKSVLSLIDLQDVQLVVGVSSLGYGLHCVYPPAAFIVIGSLLISPVVLPPLFAMWRAK